MKKRLLFLLFFTTCILVIVSGCSNKTEKVETGEPESYYVYGFLEVCSNSEKYCTIQSMEISSTYGSGYYVIIGVDTNLSLVELTDSNNQAQLGLSGGQLINLNFFTFDLENNKLIFEIPGNQDLDYVQLCNLKVSNSKSEFPFLSIFLNYFNRYCTIDGVNYAGRYFILILE